MQTFSFIEMWHAMGWPAKSVVITLWIMSIYSLAVIIERLVVYMRARGRSLSFIVDLQGALKGNDVKAAASRAKAEPQPPVARVVAAALEEYEEGRKAVGKSEDGEVDDLDVLEAMQRSIERVKEREVAGLRRGLGGLASIASAAPFVGLFGTVVGIINAFRTMAASGQGGLASVSAGIAEALVTTAFGLLVAIPAVMFYNHFTGRVDALVVDIDEVSSEVVAKLVRQGWSSVGTRK